MNRQKILVINPNSNRQVTQGMDEALEAFRIENGPEILCQTLAEGPLGIESQAQSDQVIAPLCRWATAQQSEAAALVIACFSDPGIHSVREAVSLPVFGIAEAGLTTALNLGERVGIIAILANSLPRHWRYIRALGLQERIAADLPINATVAELANEQQVFQKMASTGAALRDEHGADVLVMGCAGMARYRSALEETLKIPVVEPTQAAVGMAITTLQASSSLDRAQEF